jgi:hypothetical protein
MLNFHHAWCFQNENTNADLEALSISQLFTPWCELPLEGYMLV